MGEGEGEGADQAALVQAGRKEAFLSESCKARSRFSPVTLVTSFPLSPVFGGCSSFSAPECWAQLWPESGWTLFRSDCVVRGFRVNGGVAGA